jgi:hypothetical protein
LAEGRSLAVRLNAARLTEGRRRRIAWIVVALLMVVVPVAFNLARNSYSASLELYPRAVSGYPPVNDPAYYRAFLTDNELQTQMRFHAPGGPSAYADAVIRAGRRGRVVVTVSADAPNDAQRIVNALGPQLANATRRQLAAQAEAEAQRLRALLGSGKLTARQTRRVRRRLARANSVGLVPPERIVLGTRPGPPPLRGFADKVADAMPGPYPTRPSPLWAGFAGLLVAVTLWLIGLALLPPRGRGPVESALPPA